MTKGIPTLPTAGPGANAPCSAVTQGCPVQVTVKIKLSKPVACPGHPLCIIGVGSPAGGNYSWSVTGAELVDAAGAAVNTGDIVYLRHFHPDDATGAIPEATAAVKVTYTHPNGTATDSKSVKVHKIDFEVTDETIESNNTWAIEGNSLTIDGQGAEVNLVIEPRVKLKLDSSCPRKAECAKNHRVGWLQTLFSDDKRARYTDSELIANVQAKDLPIRDGNEAPGSADRPLPFYFKALNFAADGDRQPAYFEDTPTMKFIPWTDERPKAPHPPPPENLELRKVFFHSSFWAWLVVQNQEWSAHDLAGSFAYQRNLHWSIDFDVDVDMAAKDNGLSACWPRHAKPHIDPIAQGKGPKAPVLTDPTAEEKRPDPPIWKKAPHLKAQAHR